MNTGSFSCFLYQSLNFFVFLSLLCRGSPAIFVFLSKLHEYSCDFYLQTPYTQNAEKVEEHTKAVIFISKTP
ncbi:hypothetical protein AAZX31_12G128500 [Glycine max]